MSKEDMKDDGRLTLGTKKRTEQEKYFGEDQEPTTDEEVSLQTEMLSEQIKDAVRKVSEPAIQAEAPVGLPSGERHLTMLTSFEDIQKQAPDDPLVRAAFLPEYKEALSIVYSQLPKEKWGSEEAQRLIFKVLANLTEIR